MKKAAKTSSTAVASSHNRLTPYYQLPFYKKIARDIKGSPVLYLMLLPVLVFFILFKYFPMYGLVISFTDYYAGAPFFDLESWVGLRNFTEFFQSRDFTRVLSNTVIISLSTIIFGFPMPIIFALLLNELRSQRFSKIIQTVSYLPHFISLVVICGMIANFVGSYGFISQIAAAFGIIEPNTSLLNFPEYFVPIYVVSDIWQTVGYSSIVYLAALTGVSQDLYEAAEVDGAGRWKRLLHITLPGIFPTIMTMLLLRMGRAMTVGYEKIILLYHPTIYETADVISSFVYRAGLQQGRFSYSTAVGLFNSVINVIILVACNKISRRVTQMSLW